jgi:hypothetical protein
MRTSRASWRGAEHHERIAEPRRFSTGTDRGFGLAVSAILVVVAAVNYWRIGQIAWWMVAAALALSLCALVAPSALSPLNRAWSAIRHVLSRGTSLVLVAVIYWVAIVPAGLIMRLVGRDRLSLGLDRNASTYWSRPSPEDVDPKNKP